MRPQTHNHSVTPNPSPVQILNPLPTTQQHPAPSSITLLHLPRRLNCLKLRLVITDQDLIVLRACLIVIKDLALVPLAGLSIVSQNVQQQVAQTPNYLRQQPLTLQVLLSYFFVIQRFLVRFRQISTLCPMCSVRMNTKSTSSHESIKLFMKIYSEIFEKQKSQVEQKRKRTSLDFEIPKNIKTILILLFIMNTPWIYDALKFIVCMIVQIQHKLMMLIVQQVSQVYNVVKIIIQDEFYIGLYTNEYGEYVFHSDEQVSRAFYGQELGKHGNISATIINVFTEKHKAKLQFYFKFLSVATFLTTKIWRLYNIIYQTLRIFNYTLHFIILLAGLVQFPFVIPFLLFRIQVFVPRKYRYKIGLYLDIVQQDNADEYLQPEDLDKLSKGELFFLLLVRNYIQAVLRLYKSIESDMKKRCEELEYKKRMRQVKKNGKETGVSSSVKQVKRFTF